VSAGWAEAHEPWAPWWVVVLAWAAVTITLAAWSWRAAANVRLLAGEPRYPPTLAAVAWAVPLANLVVPFLATREAARTGDAPSVRGLGWWWALMVAWRLHAWAARTPWEDWPWVTVLLGVAAASGTVLVLGAVTRRHQRMLARR
jgi:hypothetical protein